MLTLSNGKKHNRIGNLLRHYHAKNGSNSDSHLGNIYNNEFVFLRAPSKKNNKFSNTIITQKIQRILNPTYGKKFCYPKDNKNTKN